MPIFRSLLSTGRADLPRCAAVLIGSKKARLDLPKAGVVRLRLKNGFDKGAGVLEWLVTLAWLE